MSLWCVKLSHSVLLQPHFSWQCEQQLGCDVVSCSSILMSMWGGDWYDITQVVIMLWLIDGSCIHQHRRKVPSPASVKSLRTTVTLNTLRSMRKSATMPAIVANSQAPRYGRADRKPFWADRRTHVASVGTLKQPDTQESRTQSAMWPLRPRCHDRTALWYRSTVRTHLMSFIMTIIRLLLSNWHPCHRRASRLILNMLNYW